MRADQFLIGSTSDDWSNKPMTGDSVGVAVRMPRAEGDTDN